MLPTGQKVPFPSRGIIGLYTCNSFKIQRVPQTVMPTVGARRRGRVHELGSRSFLLLRESRMAVTRWKHSPHTS